MFAYLFGIVVMFIIYATILEVGNKLGVLDDVNISKAEQYCMVVFSSMIWFISLPLCAIIAVVYLLQKGIVFLVNKVFNSIEKRKEI